MGGKSLRRPSPLLQLTLVGLAGALVYLAAFSASYAIRDGIAKPLLHFGHLTGGSPWSALGYVAAVAALFALYAAAIKLCAHLEQRRGASLVVFVIGALSAAILVPMYPVFSLDVFYYMAADRIWSVYRENPFVVPPLQAAHDPFFPYTSWGHYTLPYGPIWPWISAATSGFGQGQLAPTLLAFKALGALGYVACLPLVWWAAGGLHPERRLTATCIFAWNPLVLIELAGVGHNDAIALVPAVAAIGLWVRHRSIGMTLAIALSFTIKATISIVAIGLLWASFRRALATRHLRSWTFKHAVPAAAIVVLGWLPFWSERSGRGLAQEAEQHYQSVTAVVLALLPASVDAVAPRALQAILVAAFALFIMTQLSELGEENAAGLSAVWRVVVFYLLVVGPFFSAWYIVWPTLLAAVLADRQITWQNGLLTAGALATYTVQFVLVPAGGNQLHPAQLTLLALFVAFGPFLAGVAFTAARARLRTRPWPMTAS